MGSLRIQRKSSAVRDPSSGGSGGIGDGSTPWLERLVKLIPAEILAVYVAGKGITAEWTGTWSVLCLAALLVVRGAATRVPGRGPQWPAVGIAAVSFIIWVYADGGHFLRLLLPDASWASALVLLWPLVIAPFYKGD